MFKWPGSIWCHAKSVFLFPDWLVKENQIILQLITDIALGSVKYVMFCFVVTDKFILLLIQFLQSHVEDPQKEWIPWNVTVS